VVYVESGRGAHQVDDGTYLLVPGDIYVIPPGAAHAFSFGEQEAVSIINLLFRPEFLPATLMRTMIPAQALDYFYIHPFLQAEERVRRVVHLRGEIDSYVRCLIDQMLREWNHGHGAGQGLLRIQVLELLVLLSQEYGIQADLETCQPGSNARETVQRVLGYVEMHGAQPLRIDSLAGQFHLSRRQLERLVRQETGLTLLDHIHRLRIAHARQLLTESNASVKHIAARVGYHDPASLSRLFLRQVGCSPTAYRQQAASLH
jgi:AraC-like DNA-binding protein